MKHLIHLPKTIAKVLIRIYQKTLSTDHSFWARPDVYRICMFYPSCSEYTYQAIDKFGLVKGSYLGGKRILRCNGFGKGGHDPLPEKFEFVRTKSKSSAKA